MIYDGWSQYDNALTYYEQALELFTQLHEDSSVSGALNNIGGVYKVWGEYEQASEYFAQALELDRRLHRQADIIIGSDVNETAVKTMSVQGELARYKVLHFATHGSADSQIPELSALVLSLEAQESLPAKEDGYLRAGEIVDLDLKADFVNLSACETGLGKLYGGEGVVGLTQAFLLAGANGLSVSLWQVADDSTAQFMVAVYTLVEDEG